jgi:hypothetical protein
MQDIIEQLTEKAGLTPEQAHKALETIASYVKEKFPMIGGAVDQLFGSSGSGDSNDPGSGVGGFGGFGGFGQ